MSEGLDVARRELERVLSASDMPSIKSILRELIAHCEWQERVIADMSVRIDELDRRTKGSIFR